MTYVSSGEFSRGYQDGMKDAQRSILDDNAAWLWLWLTEDQYRKGYERGWSDGRKIEQLKAQEGLLRDEPPPAASPSRTNQDVPK